ncbi:MAG: hypothetical protein Q8N76_01135 [Candidatus Omnitrophota bacterium]|nr:hypothetical protein [Candidatus Omnitrophota bacterium]
MRKANVLFLVLAVSMIVFCGISYAAVAGFVNAAQPAAVETGAATIVEGAVRGEGKSLSSNESILMTNTSLFERMGPVQTGREDLPLVSVADITLSEGVKASIPTDVKDPVIYAVTLGVVGGVKITTTGSTYNVEENTARPVIFAAEQVLANPAVFAETVDSLETDQFAVVLSRNNEERAAVEGLGEVKARGEKVVVAPTVLTTNELLTAILEEAAKKGAVGISLSDVLSSPAVEKARKGAV